MIYRIQDKDGRGPFKPGFSDRWLCDKRSDDEYRALVPWTEEFDDLKLIHMPGIHYGCGCRSIEQLKRWFKPGEYKTLLGFGYQAVKIGVEAVLAESKIQLIFRRSRPLNENVKEIVLYK
jgi:hypothetical protein